jgi:osmoprotectant transport system permease protein
MRLSVPAFFLRMPFSRNRLRLSGGMLVRLFVLILLIVFLAKPHWFEPLLQPLVENGAPVIYNQGSLLTLTLQHLGIVFIATLGATIMALALAILVTRPAGAEFLPLSRALVNVGQTFPPVAVLALAVPAIGFGAKPTLIALFLYGLLPIFENALTGLTNLPGAVVEAAKGMGMNERQRLLKVELPLALPVILAGIRLSTVISLSTATIGSTVAAKTLGEVIIAGLISNNVAFILQGGLIVGALAVLIHDGLLGVERRLARRMGLSHSHPRA